MSTARDADVIGSDSGARRWIIRLLSTLALASAAVLAVALAYQREAALREGERASASLARLIAEQTTRSLQTVHQSLRLAESQLAVAAAAGRLNEDSARAILRKRLDGFPYLRAIWVMDSRGVITLDSDIGNIGVSLADRDYFRVFIDRPGLDFHLGQPVRSRSVGTWLISAACPVHVADQFRGIIAAAIEPPYFDRLWGDLGLGYGGSISFVRRDGMLMMRSPFVDAAMGRPLDAPLALLQSMREGAAGTARVGADADSGRSVAAYRQLPQYPDFTVLVERSHAALLAPWRRTVAVAIAAWCAALLATIMLGRLWMREWERRRRSEERSLQSQKIAAIGTLAGGIAHDFNNIIGGVLGNVTLALAELADTHPAKAFLDEIRRGGIRARALVQQILSFSSSRTGEFTVIELAPVIDETVGLLQATLGAGVKLVKVLPQARLHVRGDPTQLQQVLLNLCTNAARAVEGRSGRIEVGCQPVSLDARSAGSLGHLEAGAHAHVWVADNGTGIEPEVRKRMFEPFFTTRPKDGGTGLGLSVVHGIVAAHNGAIAVDSQVGIGSTFHVYLPLASDIGVAASEPSARVPFDAGHGERVLLVDDDDVIRLMVATLLRKHGFHVSEFSDPGAALAAFRAAPGDFDAVVTDHSMPAMSGVELTAELVRVRPGMPIVLSSGYASEELLSRAKGAGVSELVPKEDTYKDLAGVLARVLAGPAAH